MEKVVVAMVMEELVQDSERVKVEQVMERESEVKAEELGQDLVEEETELVVKGWVLEKAVQVQEQVLGQV
jgi:hypothetical protein